MQTVVEGGDVLVDIDDTACGNRTALLGVELLVKPILVGLEGVVTCSSTLYEQEVLRQGTAHHAILVDDTHGDIVQTVVEGGDVFVDIDDTACGYRTTLLGIELLVKPILVGLEGVVSCPCTLYEQEVLRQCRAVQAVIVGNTEGDAMQSCP